MLLEVEVEKRFAGFSCRMAFSLTSEKCGVFGPSGSGKSTLMNMLAGLVAPDAGTIRLNGKPLFDRKAGINLPPERRRVGVVFQHANLFPHMNVAKNLEYGMKRIPPGERHIDKDQLVEVLQLEHLLTRGVIQLSGGERQRVALGRTLLACPHLILLDEPLTGLDGQLKFQIIPHLRRVFSEFSIPLLFISHSLQEMRMMTDDVLVVRDGRIESQMTTEELARTSFGTGGQGYTNLLELGEPEDLGDMFRHQWGPVPLVLLKTKVREGGRFAINGRDILLFKYHPAATSARNMLSCTVRKIFQTDWLVGVELDCQGMTLVAEIVPQSVQELGIQPGSELVAVMKASAFQRLY